MAQFSEDELAKMLAEHDSTQAKLKRGFDLGTANSMLENTQDGPALDSLGAKPSPKDNTRTVIPDGKPKKDDKKKESKPKKKAPANIDPQVTVTGGGNDKPAELPTYTIPDKFKGTVSEQPVTDNPNLNAMQNDDLLNRLAQEDEAAQQEEHRSLLQAIMGWDDIPAGKKWNHYLQHGFLVPGALSSEEARKNAAIENQNGNNGMSKTFGQELRFRAAERKRQQSGWENLLKRWETGYYTGDEKSFFDEAERLMSAYQAGGFPVSELRHPTRNAGGHAQGAYKVIQDNYERMSHMGNWMGQIMQAAEQNPNWLNDPNSPATILFDKLAEYTIIGWAQSKGAIADAEKIRAQVEAMPPDQKNAYYKLVNMYLGSNAQNAAVALASKGNFSAREDLAEVERLLSPGRGTAWTKDANGNWQISRESWEKIAEKVVDFDKHAANAGWFGISRWRTPQVTNTPDDVNTAVTANKNSMQMFQEWMMQNADVNRKAIWEEACMLFNNYKAAYDKRLGQFGKYWGWNYTGPEPDPEFANYLGQVQSNVPVDATYVNTKFTTRSLPKPIKDPKTREGGGRSVESPFGSFQ